MSTFFVLTFAGLDEIFSSTLWVVLAARMPLYGTSGCDSPGPSLIAAKARVSMYLIDYLTSEPALTVFFGLILIAIAKRFRVASESSVRIGPEGEKENIGGADRRLGAADLKLPTIPAAIIKSHRQIPSNLEY